MTKLTREHKNLIIKRMRILKQFAKDNNFRLKQYYDAVYHCRRVPNGQKISLLKYVYLERWGNNVFDNTLSWASTIQGRDFWAGINTSFRERP